MAGHLCRHLAKNLGPQRQRKFDFLKSKKCSLFTTPSILNRKINVCIEGNIGCGKTTSLKHFRPMDRLVEIHEEPVKEWRQCGDDNPLARLYEDPERWAFTFQSLVTLTLLQRHAQTQLRPIRLMERSVFSARYIFTESMYSKGLLTDIEYEILNQWFEWQLQHNPVKIDLIIYLQTSPEVCLERIKARQRPEEQIVSLDYLRGLHELHERMLVHGEHNLAHTPKILVLNNNHDKTRMETSFQEVITDLLCKLNVKVKPYSVQLSDTLDGKQQLK